MKTSSLLIVATALSCVAAQSDPLDQFISDAFSVYTQITSVLASAASAATATSSSEATTSTSSTSRASSSSAEETSSSSSRVSSSSEQSSIASSTLITSSRTNSVSSSSSTLPTSLDSSRTSGIVGTSSIQGAAAETGTSDAPTSSTKSSNKLAIILGTVLGALALGLFLLTIIICCRRRRHRSTSPRHRALSPGDDEVDSWRASHPSELTGVRNASGYAVAVAGGAPLMAEHPAFRHQSEHQNPFVPAPPPPRRTAPNSRAGLTDGMVPGENPFLEKEIGVGARPESSKSGTSSHRKGALAAGLAGAAVGAGLMHHHKKQDDEKTLVTDESSDHPPHPSQLAPGPEAGLMTSSRISRKPVPLNSVNNSEPWPYSPVSPIDATTETAAFANFPSRASQESRRSFSRDAARANATFDQQYMPQNDHLGHESSDRSGHGQALATAAAGLAAAGVGGAAIAHHRDQRRSRSSSASSGHRHSRSPQRPPMPAQAGISDVSSSSDENNNKHSYSDALATQPTFVQPPTATNPIADPLASQPHPDPYDVPPAPVTRSRRNSALGTGAPSAAVFSYFNRPAIPSPLSSEIRHDRAFSPPRYPSRSPRRSSRGRASQDSTAYDDVYTSNPWTGRTHQVDDDDLNEYSETSNLRQDDSTKAIVGDNGYPHMGLPRRKSGGEYDFDSHGPFGPQTVVPTPSVNATRSSTMNSDDSAWRLSSGMPGGWRRGSGEYGNDRASGEYNRKSQGRMRASDMPTKDATASLGGSGRYYQSVGQAL